MSVDKLTEFERRSYTFPMKVWNLLVEHNVAQISDGFDATQEFRDHVALIYKMNGSKLNTYPKHIAYAYELAMISRSTMGFKIPDVSHRSQNVFSWLIFHLILESYKTHKDIITISPTDMSLMLGALLEILDAPINDDLAKNL